ncbi:branched-chain amino acid aminotransferase [Enemella sp. A6]|uniref:branched-chain amino acid aminotransferase n=1 Tax=Enemella sp. A6 TaxID=3440152 RepID=UPI003EBB24B2
MSLHFDVIPTATPVTAEDRAKMLADPGFGQYFTDHMARATWTVADGWHDGAVVGLEPVKMHPATAVLHYGQEIFEGLKAYRHADGSVWLFRPEINAARFAQSAHRLSLPEMSVDDFITSLEQLIEADRDWVPEPSGEGGEESLYLRPFMFADEVFLGVRAAQRVTYLCLASPAGSYFASGLEPVSIWISRTYARSGPGGTGDAKCGGNYAASLLAQTEAGQRGCSQVLFLDAAEHAYIEELGGMNVFFVTSDGELLTPPLTGTILEGVTRSSLLQLAEDHGLTAVERQLPLVEILEGIAAGTIVEGFACGTAAVITPIKSLADETGTWTIGDGGPGRLTGELRQQILDIQFGRAEDVHGWLRRAG